MQARRQAWPGWLIVLAIVALAVFLYSVRQVLPPFIIGAVLAYIFSPVVSALQRRLRLSRLPAVALFYAIVFVPLIILGVFFGRTLLDETGELIARAPGILANLLRQIFGAGPVIVFGRTLLPYEVATLAIDSLWAYLGTPQEAVYLATLAFEVIVDVFLSLVVLFYLLLDREQFVAFAVRLLPAERRPRALFIGGQVNRVLGRYVRGVFFLVVFMTAATWLGLALLGIRYAFPVAVATGILEIIPFVGPVVAGAIAVVVALTHHDVGRAVAVGVFYLVLRQLEDQVVAPQVLGRAVALHPVTVIFAVLAGGAVAGLLGVLLAIPVAAAIKVIGENLSTPPPAAEPPPAKG